MKINEIDEEYQNKDQNWFYFRIEHEMFNEALQCFADKRYATSATIAAVLFEKIFTTRFIRETGSLEIFALSKSNIKEQLDYILDKERKVVDGDNPDNKKGMSFYEITKELKRIEILSKEEKDEFDDFYSNYRNSVIHGLTYRLFEKVFNRKPAHFLAPDAKYDEMYKKVSELIINKIYELVSKGKFIKK